MAALPDSRRSTQITNGIHSRSVSPIKGLRKAMTLPPHQINPITILSPTPGPAREPSPVNDGQTSAEPDILTALAAQERRVLELKEALEKAEDELVKLRRQWATHESLKRRNEKHMMHQMKPINALPTKVVNPDDDPDGSSAWMYEEMERRKALLGNAKSSHRRVFSGSRETKTLSLLSPEKFSNPAPTSDNMTGAETRRSRDPVKQASPSTHSEHRFDRSIEGTQFPPPTDIDNRNNSRSPQREAILQTGKQFATDFRDGLWTFLEDLRQAAVGDEVRVPAPASSTNGSRRGSPAVSNTRRKSPDRKANGRRSRIAESEEEMPSSEEDAGSSFWKGQIPEPTIIAIPTTPKKQSKRRSTHQGSPIPTGTPPRDDNFSAWNSSPLSSSAATKRSSTIFSQRDNDRDSISTGSLNDAHSKSEHDVVDKLVVPKQRDAIPWPELTKLAPGNFKRTASELMAELERSLTPSSRAEGEGEDDKNATSFFDGMMT